MIKIGLTGGIGTGKSTVAKIFENQGIPVYYADDRAKEIMRTDPDIISQIKALFGEEAYQDNELNTKHIGDIVFDNKNMLSKLESIVHPAVRKDFLEWVEQQEGCCILVENAILYKSGMYKLVDKIILVTADDEKRIARLKKRDKKSIKDLKKVINLQKVEQKLLKNADFFVKNNKSVNDLINKAKEILSIMQEKC